MGYGKMTNVAEYKVYRSWWLTLALLIPMAVIQIPVAAMKKESPVIKQLKAQNNKDLSA